MCAMKRGIETNKSIYAIAIGLLTSLVCAFAGVIITTFCIQSNHVTYPGHHVLFGIIQLISVFTGSFITGITGKGNSVICQLVQVTLYIAVEIFLACVLYNKITAQILLQLIWSAVGLLCSFLIISRIQQGNNAKKHRRIKRFVQNTQRGK